MQSDQRKDALEVRIERLEPMCVASVRCHSATPEQDAWAKLSAWAESQGLLVDLDRHPVFGFNHPNPSPTGGMYGYELWIRIDEETEVSGEVQLKQFSGGLYAVTTCSLHGDPEGTVPEVWRKLWDWVQESDYEWRPTHELERARDPRASEHEFLLDLYLPIEG